MLKRIVQFKMWSVTRSYSCTIATVLRKN